MYTFVKYKPSYEDTCMGCHMATFYEQFDIHSTENLNEILSAIKEIFMFNSTKNSRDKECTYAVLWNGHCVYSTIDCYYPYFPHDEFEEEFEKEYLEYKKEENHVCEKLGELKTSFDQELKIKKEEIKKKEAEKQKLRIQEELKNAEREYERLKKLNDNNSQ